MFYFFKAIFDTSFGSSGPFFGLVNATEEFLCILMVNNPYFVQAGIPRGRDIAKTVFRLVAAGRYTLLNQFELSRKSS